MAAAAAPPHLAGHHFITITPLPATHQQRQHHQSAAMAAQPSSSTVAAAANHGAATTTTSISIAAPRTATTNSNASPPATDRASSAHHCTSHRPSSRLRTCNFEPSSGATRDHHSRTCNHRAAAAASITVPPLSSPFTHLPSPEKKTSPEQPARQSNRAVTREGEECESETLILERESALCATCQHLIEQSNWSTLVNWSKSAVNSGQNCKYG